MQTPAEYQTVVNEGTWLDSGQFIWQTQWAMLKSCEPMHHIAWQTPEDSDWWNTVITLNKMRNHPWEHSNTQTFQKRAPLLNITPENMQCSKTERMEAYCKLWAAAVVLRPKLWLWTYNSVLLTMGAAVVNVFTHLLRKPVNTLPAKE